MDPTPSMLLLPCRGVHTEAPEENLSSLRREKKIDILFSLIFVLGENKLERERRKKKKRFLEVFHVEKPFSCLHHIFGRQGGRTGLPRRCCRGAKAISFELSLRLSNLELLNVMRSYS
jgi:hypothetical protein